MEWNNLLINQLINDFLSRNITFELQSVSKPFYYMDSLVLIDPFDFQKKSQKSVI